MNKNLEARLRLKVRGLLESALKEEGVMPPPADDMNRRPVVASKSVKIGDFGVMIGKNDSVNLQFKGGANATIQREDAVKLANYLIRVLGKV